ncbi:MULTISPECIES: antibiotic biosynthesis monooxygenase [Chelativorans]|jgi:heme-degrading monooxygenase HmoA|nr:MULTISPECIES: antibiotic biosynthesis monooxygenase [Chelativorans]
MLLKIGWGRLRPGGWEDFERDYVTLHDSNLVAGRQSYYLVQDITQPDAGFALTVWSNEAELAAYDNSALRQQTVSQLQKHFTDRNNNQICRIRHHKTWS